MNNIKQFRSHGKAYLFSDCVNIYTGSPEDRILLTGVHTVVDIFCRECKTLLGWKYVTFSFNIFKISLLSFFILLFEVLLNNNQIFRKMHLKMQRNIRWENSF